MIFLKKHATQHGAILAMCDEELVGKVFKSGKLLLDLDRYASFYQGELVSEEKASSAVGVEDIYSANIVGERSVAIMLSKGIVGKEAVKNVGNVPFVHIYKVDVL